MRSTRRVRVSGERGSASVELVLLTPLLVTLILFAVLLGRLGTARLQVDSAARQAARSASLARTAPAAQARATAADALAGQHITCATLTVDVDLDAFAPGGMVTVRVSCVVSLAQLGLLHTSRARRH